MTGRASADGLSTGKARRAPPRLSSIEKAAGKLERGPEPLADPVPAAPTDAPRALQPPGAETHQHGLVRVDRARLYAKGIASPVNSRSTTSEEFRRIKRSVVGDVRSAALSGLRSNLIMVTSALPGEGKTFVSIGLAMSIALEPDYRVLCVDGDLIRPRLDKELGFKASRGLVDLLLDPSMDIAEVVLPTDVEGLTILPAGSPHPLTADLVASNRMQFVLNELKSRYPDRIIVFDTPPLLVTSEALALAQYMDQILLVVAAEQTPTQNVALAVEQIQDFTNIKIVFNKARHGLGSPPSFDQYYYRERAR